MNGVVCYDLQNKFGSRVYEFIINPNDSNPATRVKYQGENENYKSAYMDYTEGKFNYGDWAKAFFMSLFKPCMLNPDGTVKYYLDENDYSLQADGVTPSEISDTTQTANAMVEIGQIWIKEEELSGGDMRVCIANEQIDDSYDCYTHQKKDGSYCDYVYRSIYDGCNISNKIRSLSGQAICKTVAGDTQITYAKANGTGWNVDKDSELKKEENLAMKQKIDKLFIDLDWKINRHSNRFRNGKIFGRFSKHQQPIKHRNTR